MSHIVNEPPLRFMGQILEEAADMDRGSIDEHYQACHFPPPPH